MSLLADNHVNEIKSQTYKKIIIIPAKIANEYCDSDGSDVGSLRGRWRKKGLYLMILWIEPRSGNFWSKERRTTKTLRDFRWTGRRMDTCPEIQGSSLKNGTEAADCRG